MHIRWISDGEGTVGAVEINTLADRDLGDLAGEVTEISDGYLDMAIRRTAALEENEDGWPVILNGLPHTVSHKDRQKSEDRAQRHLAVLGERE